MKKTVFAILIALSGSVILSMAQPARQGHMERAKDPKQVEVAIAKRVAEMKVRLSLSDKQAAELTKIFTQTHATRVAQAQAMRERAQKEREEMKTKRAQEKAQVEAVLTPAQREELTKMYSTANVGKFHNNGDRSFKKSATNKGYVHMGMANGKGNVVGNCKSCSCEQSAPYRGGSKHKGARKGYAAPKVIQGVGTTK